MSACPHHNPVTLAQFGHHMSQSIHTMRAPSDQTWQIETKNWRITHLVCALRLSALEGHEWRNAAIKYRKLCVSPAVKLSVHRMKCRRERWWRWGEMLQPFWGSSSWLLVTASSWLVMEVAVTRFPMDTGKNWEKQIKISTWKGVGWLEIARPN